MLKLFEKFILLALDQKKGKFLIDALALNYGLAGAILLELSEQNKISLQEKRIIVKDKKYTSNQIIDAGLKLINASRNNKKPRFWIYKIGNKSSGFRKIILKDLYHKNIIKLEEKSIFFGLFKVKRYPVLNSVLVDEIKNRLRNIVLGKEKAQIESILLLSLMSSVKLTRILFPNKKDHKYSRKRIKELTKEIEIGEAVSQTLKEIQAAIVVATSSTFVGG